MTRNTKITVAERVEIIRDLIAILPEGTTVYTVIHAVASSGMSRTMTVFAVVNGEVRNLNYRVAQLGIGTLTKNDQIRVSGTGMDMGFHVVYSLSRALYEGTGSTDAGYSLNHRWL